MSIEGRRIGQYQVLRRLGLGGMAEVYVAERVGPSGFRRAVALKVLRPHLRDADAVVGRFTREARLAASLRHPNLVPVVDFGVEAGLAFLAMDLVDGPDLRDATREGARLGHPLPAWLAVHVAIQVARGLAYAHGFTGPDGRPLGFVHRDVSPQNILLSRTGEVRLADFGIATAVRAAETSPSGALRGKLAYLAPEQVAGRTPDARADLFALGVVLWELLAGRRLFLGATDAETLARVRACEVPIPPTDADSAAVPPRVWDTLRHALAAEPGARTASAGALALSLAAAWPEADRGEATTALAAWVGLVSGHEAAATPARERPVPARPVEPAETPTVPPTVVTVDLPPPRPAARRRRTWVLGGVAVGLAAIGLGLAARPRPPAVATAPGPETTVAAPPNEPREGPAEAARPRADQPGRDAPAARARGRSGALLVTTRPSGATIDLDGRSVGRTPKRVEPLVPGVPIVVVLRLDGHRPVERTLTPRASGLDTLDLTLEPAFGLLSLDADPWADVTLDGRAVGSTPLLARRVPAGRRTVRLAHPPTGAVVELVIDVEADEHVRRRVALERPR